MPPPRCHIKFLTLPWGLRSLKMKKNYNSLWVFRQQFNNSIKTIPKKNKAKFQVDLLKLIELAHEDNYESFEL